MQCQVSADGVTKAQLSLPALRRSSTTWLVAFVICAFGIFLAGASGSRADVDQLSPNALKPPATATTIPAGVTVPLSTPLAIQPLASAPINSEFTCNDT